MKVLRSRILVTLVLAAIALALGSGVALASLRSWSTATSSGSSVSLGDRPTATPSSGEPDVGGVGKPQQRGLQPIYPAGSPEGSWWTWISRFWASWIGKGVR
jgi:hypothetical protein